MRKRWFLVSSLSMVLVLSALGAAAASAVRGQSTAPDVLSQVQASDWPQLQYGPKRTGHNPQLVKGPFSRKWMRDLGVPMAERVQPVVAYGLVVVGDLSGTVHALAEADGRTAWTFAADGAILHSAAMDQGKVFVGSHGGSLYALAADGDLVWRASVPKGVGGSPLVWNDRVYVSGKDGLFYAFDEETGVLAWKFDTAATTPPSVRAPILSSPAVHPGKNLVFFAAENLKAYALDARTGVLVWAVQMFGESTSDSWPVVSETRDVVMFRTKSVYSFHASLALDDGDLFCPGEAGGGCGSCASFEPDNWDSPGEQVVQGGTTNAQWNEQHLMNGDGRLDSIDEILQAYPQRRTFYAFDPGTGAPKWARPAPVLWTAGGGRVGIMPVVNDATGDIYTFWRTKWSRHDSLYFCRKWVDVGRLTVRGGLPTVDFLPCPQGLGTQCWDGWEDFHFIGDETTALSLAGSFLVLTARYYDVGGIYVADDPTGCPGDYCRGNTDNVVPAGSIGDAGGGSDLAAPASIANRTVYVKGYQNAGFGGDWTVVAAYAGR